LTERNYSPRPEAQNGLDAAQRYALS
jgi:hypothetical protein